MSSTNQSIVWRDSYLADQPLYLINRPFLLIPRVSHNSLSKMQARVISLIDDNSVTDGCTPFYNRCNILSDLLSSVLDQAFDHSKLPKILSASPYIMICGRTSSQP